MLKHLVCALSVGLLAAPAWSQTQATPQPVEQAQAADASGAAPQQVLVSGVRPGPGLWKISKGDHVLWVFGTYAPLPQKMTWRSHEVEKILGQSQEYLYPPGFSMGVHWARSLTLLPFAIGIKKLPDGATLRDVLPADVYARWLLMKAKYIGDNEGIERERPMFVAQTLFQKGLAQAGLSSGGEVSRAIEDLAKKKNVKMTSSRLHFPIDDPVKAIKDMKKSSFDDVACFAKTLDLLETDIDALRVRANAWAKGDLDAIQKLSFSDRKGACDAAMMTSQVVQERAALRGAQEKARAAWLATAEKSLTTNASTFTTLPLSDILDPKGVVAALEAKGYVVTKPE